MNTGIEFPQEHKESPLTANWWVVALVVLVVIGALVYYFVFFDRQIAEEEYTRAFRDGRTSFITGDHEGAVQFFEDAVSKAETDIERARARLELGLSYFGVNPVRGTEILKDMSLDASIPPAFRVQAAHRALGYYISTKKVAFAFENLFTGPQWGAFAEGVNNDVAGAERATHRAYEWAAGIHPTFMGEYKAGRWYANQLAYGQLSNERVEEYADAVETRLAAGDALFYQSIENNTAAQSEVGIGYNQRAHLLEGLYAAGRVEADEVRTAYENAGTVYQSASRSVQSRRNLRFNQHALAAFLLRAQAADSAEVQEILTPIYNRPPGVGLEGVYFDYLRALPSLDTPLRQDAVRLAQADERFRDILLNLGWSESDFN